MAKKYIIYANGVDLAKCPVTQNEVGKYYWNGKIYYKPVLSKFDYAIPPSGYKKYFNGSHTRYIGLANRHPVDISLKAESEITANFNFRIKDFTYEEGAWGSGFISGTNKRIPLVHTYKFAKIGSIVKAGDVICKVAPTKISGVAPHLHIDEWTGFRIRDLILDGNFKMATAITKGRRVEILADTNMRKGDGITFPIHDVVKKGAIGIVNDGPRAKNGYEWWDIYFKKCPGVSKSSAGWMANVEKSRFKVTTKAQTCIDGTSGVAPEPPKPPVDPCFSYKAKITTLESDIKKLETKVSDKETIINTKSGELAKEITRGDDLEETIKEKNEYIDEIKEDLEDKESEYSELETLTKEEALRLATAKELWNELFSKLFGNKVNTESD